MIGYVFVEEISDMGRKPRALGLFGRDRMLNTFRPDRDKQEFSTDHRVAPSLASLPLSHAGVGLGKA